MKTIYLAGGCFWCIGDYLLSFSGIEDVISGYSGGKENPVTYEEVKSQKTMHRETVEIHYNENKIKEDEIIDIYFSYINPFDQEGQFIDKGHSYTLAMYYQNEKEKELFENKVKELQKSVESEIFISVEPFKFFVKAEEYHQHYGDKNPEALKEELINSNRVCHLARFKKN